MKHEAAAGLAHLAVRLDRVHFRYGERAPVFAGLSVAIESGRITCLVGPSGCGKSTLLHLIAGLLEPDDGAVYRRVNMPDNRTGFLFQQDALLPWRTVRGNLNLASELRGTPPAADECRIREHFATFHLDGDILERYPEELSGGMRQRVAVIQALMADPLLMLLDEPFGALDIHTRLRLETEFRAMVLDRAITAVFVTHDIEQAIAIGDRVLVLGGPPRGIVADIPVEFGAGIRPAPDAVRGEQRFGDYYTRIWRCLRDAI